MSQPGCPSVLGDNMQRREQGVAGSWDHTQALRYCQGTVRTSDQTASHRTQRFAHPAACVPGMKRERGAFPWDMAQACTAV